MGIPPLFPLSPEADPNNPITESAEILQEWVKNRLGESTKAKEKAEGHLGDLHKELEAKLDVIQSLDKTSPEYKELVANLIENYNAAALKNRVDPEEYVNKRMSERGWARNMLTDFLHGYGRKDFKTTRQHLLQQEMAKKALRNQSMGIIADTFESLGMQDVSRQRTATDARNKEIDAYVDVYQAHEKARLSIQQELGLIGVNTMRIGAQAQVDFKRDRLKHIDTMLAIDRRAWHQRVAALVERDNNIGPRIMPFRHPAGDVEQYGHWAENVWVPAKNATRLKVDAQWIERRPVLFETVAGYQAISAGLKQLEREGGQARLIQLRDKLERAFPAAAVSGVASETLTSWLKGNGLVLDSTEAQIVMALNDVTLLKVRAISGKQVTDKERTYITTTLPALIQDPSTFGIGIEIQRITSEILHARAQDTRVDENGLSQLTYRDEDGATKWRDFTDQVLAWREEASIIEREAVARGEGPGAGVEYLRAKSGTKLAYELPAGTKVDKKFEAGLNDAF